jgi:hypothetical protein
MAEEHDLTVEWMLPTFLPPDYEKKSVRSQNPSGMSLGPPKNLHGLVPNGS